MKTIVGIACALVLLVSCATQTMSLPAAPADIRGTITKLDANGLLVEESPGDTSGSKKAMVKLAETTLIAARDGKLLKPADLRAGQVVSVWYSGPVNYSYPLRAAAATVVVE